MLPVAVAQVSPSPTPSPTPRFELHIAGSTIFVDQSTAGVGQVPPEGAPFIAGAPAAPLTPYDWFTTMPLVPGVSGGGQYLFTGTLHERTFSLHASALLSGIAGDPTNVTYWGEPLLGQFDPLEGRSALTVPVAYPTHAGSNDVLAASTVLPYTVSLRGTDDRWKISAGFVQTANYDGFVFVQPPYSTYLPSMSVQTFETLGPGLRDLDSWSHLAPALPMLGVDATARAGAFTLEATDALAPAPAGSAVRMTGGTLAYHRGDAQFSADVVHVLTNGAPLTVPTLFGFDPSINPGAQGPLALSTIAGQAQTLAGARAFFHPGTGYDATIELGRSWYNASLVARPGTNAPGNFQHYALTRHFGEKDSASVEYYRMDPRYASALLPYGTPLNVWGIAWAYPGPWLKGTYQLVNNAWGGSNREGLRARGTIVRGPWTASLGAYSFQQVEPSTLDNLTRTGFVEVDYLVLSPGDEMKIGRTQGIDGYLAWSGARDTISLDYADDTQRRDCAAASPVDCVAMHYPQTVLAEQHAFSPKLIASVGYARYGAVGSWTTTPVHDFYGMGFAGVQADFGRFGQLYIQLRRYGVRGYPSIPGGPPPTLTGTGLVVDHHFSL